MTLFIKNVLPQLLKNNDLLRHIEKDDWKTWQRLYPDIKFKINADINISDTGLVE